MIHCLAINCTQKMIADEATPDANYRAASGGVLL